MPNNMALFHSLDWKGKEKERAKAVQANHRLEIQKGELPEVMAR